MNSTVPLQLRRKVEDLIRLLDRDVEYLNTNLERLDLIRTLVVKRQDRELSRLLDTLRIESEGYGRHESRRHLLRQEIADLLDCNVHDLTLSGLGEWVDDALRQTLTQRKHTLRELTQRLRREHLSTSWLLRDCARFNTVLYNALFHPGQENALTYNIQGATERHRAQSLMNLQF